MAVLRIVPNIAGNPTAAASFYRGVLSLDIVMDYGWIVTFASRATQRAQVSVATEGGSCAPVPDISIEVDDLDESCARARCGLCDRIWASIGALGRAPLLCARSFGRLVNVLAHGD